MTVPQLPSSYLLLLYIEGAQSDATAGEITELVSYRLMEIHCGVTKVQCLLYRKECIGWMPRQLSQSGQRIGGWVSRAKQNNWCSSLLGEAESLFVIGLSLVR